MKTKIVKTKSGQSVCLYFNESTLLWCLSEDEAKDNFSKYIIEGENIPFEYILKINKIKRYYLECKIEYTQNKIVEMINADIKNIPIVYDMIMVALIEGRR